MKTAIAVLAVFVLAAVTTLALYHGLRWWAAVRSGNDRMAGRNDAELTRLRDERRRLLNHLREIRFDFETGKIDAEDFRQLEERYEREAIAVLEALDRRSAGDDAARDEGGSRGGAA